MPGRGRGRSRGRNDRRNCKWLHAGLVRDNRGVVRDIWYAFPKNKKGNRKKIEYASDNQGKCWANYDAGELKRDMISWDNHHVQKVLDCLTGYGTWRRGHKMAGKKKFRKTLLETYLDHRFHDPYPNGREDRTFGPTLNVIFYEDDNSGAATIIPRNLPERILEQKKCYPGSRIPLSINGIDIDAWKAVNPQKPDAKQVVINFLTALMAKGIFVLHGEQQLKRIESAFFELGYRINRAALRKANADMKAGKIMNAFGCALWRKNPPLRVDSFKGQDIERLMKGMRDDSVADDEDEDEDNDDSDDEGGGPGNSGNNADNSSSEDSDSDSEPDDEPLFVPQSHSSTPGIGPSNYRQRADTLLQRSILQQFPSLTPDDDADGAGTGSSGLSSNGRDNDYDYLSESSPDKGKGKASLKTISFGMPASDSDHSLVKRAIVIESDGEDADVKPRLESPTKRVKTGPGHRIVIDLVEDSDSDFEIDEDRSSAPAIKNEGLLLKNEIVQVKDDMEDEKKAMSKIE